MNKISFGKTSWGKETYKYTIENSNGMKVVVTDMGASVVEIWVKDREGALRDVALGYDDVQQYEKEGTYFGAIVGPNANRIAGAKFEMDGVVYQLEANDNENNLHSGVKGLSRVVWTLIEHQKNRIIFSHSHYGGGRIGDGFPGKYGCNVTYEVTDQNELVISYYGIALQKTIFNMTNHTYFNLNGHNSGTILEHELMIKASGYTPVADSKAIPTGEIAKVENTPFDFRTSKPVGRDIEADFDQLKYGQGYDHNFAIDHETDKVEKIAEVYSTESGIRMEVDTDCVGVQLYTGNFLGGDKGKGGHNYERRAGLCLETQYFPNALNEPNFLSPIVEEGHVYTTQTVYRFSVK